MPRILNERWAARATAKARSALAPSLISIPPSQNSAARPARPTRATNIEINTSSSVIPRRAKETPRGRGEDFTAEYAEKHRGGRSLKSEVQSPKSENLNPDS